MYAIVLAGGGGSRLWPLSRAASPKQLLPLLGNRTLIQETVDRLAASMPRENIVIVTGAGHAPQVRDQVPDLPPTNVLVEPVARGTAPAIGLGLLHVERLAAARGDQDPVVGSFHADHVIRDGAEFQAVVRDAAAVAGQGFIVTLGITPDRPHTGYGYIERGAPLPDPGAHAAYRVARFVEKPPLAVAQQYLATGRYSWNSGIFLWRLSTILGEYERLQPALTTQLRTLAAAHDAPDYDSTLLHIWAAMRSETIDVGIAEKSDRMAVIPADFGWTDVGDWSMVAELVAAAQGDAAGNGIRTAHHLGLDTSCSLIHSAADGKLIVTIGVDNMVIIDTEDVLLVCARSHNQDVKKVVDQLKAEGRTEYL